MFEFANDLTRRDDKGVSYYIDAEVYSPYNYMHGFSTDEGYNIIFNGADHFLRVPKAKTFEMTFTQKFKDGFIDLANADWGVVFDYDDVTRKAYRLRVKYLFSGKTEVSLSAVSGGRDKGEVVFSKTFDKARSDNDINLCKVSVEVDKLRFSLGEIEFVCALEPKGGKVGFFRGDGYRELVISDLCYRTEESFSERKILGETTFVIPRDNGNDLPYKLTLSVVQTEDLFRLKYKLGGSYLERGEKHAVGDVWLYIFDDMKEPFIRIGDGKRLYIDNGSLRFSDNNYPNVPLHDETEKTYEKIYRVVKSPIEGEFYLTDIPEDDFTVSFGFKDLVSIASEHYSGEREFVFSKDGKLLFSGEIRDHEFNIKVSSPVNARLKKYIAESDVIERENAMKHLEGNHYFDLYDDILFEVSVKTDKDEKLIQVKTEIENAFFEYVEECVMNKTDGKYKVSAKGLSVGVYHLAVKVYYCNREVASHISAFEVLDPECVLSPQQESGLPVVYANDGAPVNYRSAAGDPWNIKADANSNHYYSIAHFLPARANEVRAWELLRLYNKKLLVWCTQRAVDRDDYLSGNIEKSEVIRHADFINYGYPGIEESRIYYRYDYFEREVYDGALRGILQDFLDKNPSICALLGFSNVIEKLDDAMFDALLKKCAPMWIDYANSEIKKLFDEQWQRIKAINPIARRQSYGPWNAYQSVLMGAYNSKWFGGDPTKWNEIMDGFYQFEDYPFVCGYSTTRGAWGLATQGFLCPDLVIYPELYDGFKAGCPDGFVSCGTPPVGEFRCDKHLETTQMSEYVFNTCYYKCGEYGYWKNRGFMLFSLFSTDLDRKYGNFLKSWGVIRNNYPKKPIKPIAFVYAFDKSEDRIDLNFDRHAVYNISESNESYLYKIIRENGIGCAVVTDFAALLSSETDNFSAIVLPSLDGVGKRVEKAVRELHRKGIPIFSVGSIGNLGDIFGVKKSRTEAEVSLLNYRGKSEKITMTDAEFFSVPESADVIVNVNGKAMLTKKGKAYHLSASVCQVGVDNYRRLPYQSRNNISILLAKAVTDCFSESVSREFICDDGCGLTSFINERGEENLLVIDYSDLAKCYEKGYMKTAVIYVAGNGVKDVFDLSLGEDAKLTKMLDNGYIRAFSVNLKERQSCLLRVLR